MRVAISVLLLVLVCNCARATPHSKLPSHEINDRLRQIIPEIGCNVNLCFALDGSGSVREADFEGQKNFILDVVSILTVDSELGLAAVQYGAGTRPISRFTLDNEAFRRAVFNARSLQADRTDIAAGLSFCFNQLRRGRGDVNSIVILTDGRSNSGEDPVAIANRIRQAGVQVVAVEVGFGNKPALLDIVGGDSSKILSVDDFIELIILIEDIIKEVCEN